MRAVATIAFCVALLIGCKERPYYSNKILVDKRGWEYDNEISFSVDVKNINEMYDIFLNLGHIRDFDYQNLYLDISTTYPDVNKSKDRLSLQLMNKMGKWNGDCGGQICSSEFVLKENFKFKESGAYIIGFSQGSRTPILQGIQYLQLEMYPSKESRTGD